MAIGSSTQCHAGRNFNVAQSAALAPLKETPSLVPNYLSRSADIFFPNWSHGCPATLDVHIISHFNNKCLGRLLPPRAMPSRLGPGTGLLPTLSACCSVGAEFIPLVIETLGGSTEDAISTIRTLGQAIGRRAAVPDPSISIKHWFHRVAIALWRGSARLWLHRHPTLPPSFDGVI